MKTLEKLKHAGLTQNEAKVYLSLLKIGPSNANALAKEVALDRSLTYTILNNLTNKALTSHVIKDKKRIFAASSPQNLLSPIKSKEQLIKELIKELESITPKRKSENQVTIFEGKEGLRHLFKEGFNKKSELLFLGGTGKSYDILKWEMKHIIDKFIKEKYKGRAIVSYSSKNHEMKNISNLKVKTIKGLETQATTSISEDTVAIHTLNQKPLIIIIKNQEIADSYRQYFEFLWKISN